MEEMSAFKLSASHPQHHFIERGVVDCVHLVVFCATGVLIAGIGAEWWGLLRGLLLRTGLVG